MEGGAEMSTEAQRIAIAEACGWKLVTNDPDYQPYWLSPNGNKVGTDCGVRIPDYFNDLNAMHEAEEKISGNQFRYMDTLRKVCWGNDWLTCHATAAQRAEAFLKTINKWTNDS